MEPTEGLEPPTVGLQIRRTTSCATLAAIMPSLISFMNASAVKYPQTICHGMAGENLLNASGALKQGSDTIFSWWRGTKMPRRKEKML